MSPVSLKKILNQKVFSDFRQVFFEITGMFTSLYIPGWKKGQVDFVPSDASLRFCRIIHTCPQGRARCEKADSRTASAAAEHGKPLIAPCYAGVTGVAVPIYFRGKFLGAMFAGDCLSRPPSSEGFARIRKKLSSLDMDFDELEKAYYEIPVMKPRNIRLAIDMLSLIVNYIVESERVIDLQENIYQKQKKLSSALAKNTQLEKGMQKMIDEITLLRRQLVVSGSQNVLISDDEHSRRGRIMREAVAYIDSFYTENVTLHDVADHVGISPNYFSLLFRKENGCAFTDYLVRKRISKACELLQDLRLNVTEICFRVGYSNISYFNQVFKKIVGMPPGQFRKRIQTQ